MIGYLILQHHLQMKLNKHYLEIVQCVSYTAFALHFAEKSAISFNSITNTEIYNSCDDISVGGNIHPTCCIILFNIGASYVWWFEQLCLFAGSYYYLFHVNIKIWRYWRRDTIRIIFLVQNIVISCCIVSVHPAGIYSHSWQRFHPRCKCFCWP